MTRGSKQNGIVLIIVLWTLALMTLIVVAISAFAQRGISLASVDTNRLRSDWALSAGVEAAKGYIVGLSAEERLALDGRELTLDVGEGRRVRLVIREGAGLVDLNRADVRLLEGALRAAGLNDSQIAPLIQQLSTLRIKAAEATKARPPARNQTNTPQSVSAGLVSMAQLRGLAGVDAEALEKAMPFFGLYSGDGKLNPLAAPETVLMVVPGMEPAELGAIRAAKTSRTPKRAVAAVIEKHGDFLAVNEARTFAIAATTEAGPGLIAGDRSETVVILETEDRVPKFRTLALSW